MTEIPAGVRTPSSDSSTTQHETTFVFHLHTDMVSAVRKVFLFELLSPIENLCSDIPAFHSKRSTLSYQAAVLLTDRNGQFRRSRISLHSSMTISRLRSEFLPSLMDRRPLSMVPHSEALPHRLGPQHLPSGGLHSHVKTMDSFARHITPSFALGFFHSKKKVTVLTMFKSSLEISC